MARIVIKFGTKAERIIDLDVKEFVVGRGSDALLELDHDLVSRKHCQIRLVGDGHVVEDLESKTGTVVNGERVQAHILQTGDELSVGPWTLVYLADVPTGAGDGVSGNTTYETTGAFWTQAAEDSGVITQSQEALAPDAGGDPYAGLRTVAASMLKPRADGQSDMDDYKGTMVASADEMARVRELLETSQQPHLTVNVGGKVQKLKLEDTTFEVAYLDGADFQLPGSKWLGKKQFLLSEQEGGKWTVEATSFWANVRVKGVKVTRPLLLKDNDVIEAAGLKFRFKKGN